MGDKLTVAVFFGGRSAEHSVSLVSARFIIDTLDRDKYEIIPIGIERSGVWRYIDLLEILNAPEITLSSSHPRVSIRPGKKELIIENGDSPSVIVPDIAFPVLHGPYGEDGSMQGLFRQMNLPFVGADVLGSAAGMDKDVMKRLLKEAGISIGKFITVCDGEEPDFERIEKELGFPIFIKPANMGSSIGVSRAESREDLIHAYTAARQYDRKIIFEENIAGREIECSVMGNETPEASVPGEIVADEAFYSYDSKYAESSQSKLIIPAEVSDEQKENIRKAAVKAYRALNCEGLARMDFFLSEKRGLLVNEINTLPGFTIISMYPKLWAADGLKTPELLDRLIRYGLDRHKKISQLKVDV